MSLRRDFVLRAIGGTESHAALCREFGISRKTGYKWIERFRERGLEGLVDQSRRPTGSPLKTSAELTIEILKLKGKHKSWGPKKIWGVLRRSIPETELPSVRTVARILDRAGLVKKRRRYRPATGGKPARAPRYSVDGPNDLWTVDFKGWWRTRDGERCEPLTIRDAHSRFVLAVRILPRTTAVHVRAVFEELFEKHGLPKAIQSDNGQPWASAKTPGGLTRLSAWWVSQGIEIVRSRVGCPQDNGAHERMHGDMRIEIQQDAARTLVEQQAVCDEWVNEFNFIRPHESLDLRTPAELYKPSKRRPGRLIIGGYPDCCEVMQVSKAGVLTVGDGAVYITTAIGGYPVGIQHLPNHAVVWFFDHPLGTFVPEVDRRMTPFDFETCHPGTTEEVTPRVTVEVTEERKPTLQSPRNTGEEVDKSAS